MGGAQRLCSMNGWRLATKSELISAWNAGLKKIETYDTTIGTQPSALNTAWSYEGECISMTSSSSPTSGACPSSDLYATFCYTGSNVNKGNVGYTLPIVCSDTGTGPIKVDGKTVGYNGRLTDSKFIFVEVVDVNEQPSIENDFFQRLRTHLVLWADHLPKMRI